MYVSLPFSQAVSCMALTSRQPFSFCWSSGKSETSNAFEWSSAGISSSSSKSRVVPLGIKLATSCVTCTYISRMPKRFFTAPLCLNPCHTEQSMESHWLDPWDSVLVKLSPFRIISTSWHSTQSAVLTAVHVLLGIFADSDVFWRLEQVQILIFHIIAYLLRTLSNA